MNMSFLVDPYSRRIDYLRLAVTDRCNLRCVYCMPEEGIPHLDHREILTYEEIIRFIGVSVHAGISKVRLTGGEPLVRKDLVYLIGEISRLHPTLDISLTTNGTLLAGQAENLRKAGLGRVNISIDSLNPDTYREITRRDRLSDVLEGVEASLGAGMDPVKINVVVMRHLQDELHDFIELTRRLPVHVRFIEYMSPCGTFDSSFYVSAEEIKKCLREYGELELSEPPQGAGPAVYYRLPGAKGLMGFISPVSSHFCPTCNRLRLTADGKLKPCLFSRMEFDVRDVMRNNEGDEPVLGTIRCCLESKPRDHGGFKVTPGRTMSQIGG